MNSKRQERKIIKKQRKGRIMIKNAVRGTTNPACDSNHNKCQCNRCASQNTSVLSLDKVTRTEVCDIFKTLLFIRYIKMRH